MHFSAGAFAFGNGLHALLIAAFAGTKNQDRPRVRAAGGHRVRSHRHHVRRTGAIADADAHPTPTPYRAKSDPTVINSTVSSGAALTNLGSNFLERLGNQSSNGFNRLQRTNPGGGGASESTEAPRYRTWFEGYGNFTKTGAVGDFVGDSRKTWGGVAGIGARVAPGFNIRPFDRPEPLRDRYSAGAAIGDDRPDADRLHGLGRQWAVDLGQRGGARLRQHQFAPRHRLWPCDRRLQCAARRRPDRDQLLLDQDQGRIVPKAAFEYVRAPTGALQEFGGLDPVPQQGRRSSAGGSCGRGGRPLLDIRQKIFDLSAYGKFVDNVLQNFSEITVSLGIQGIVAGYRRKPLWHGYRRLGFADLDQYRAALHQLRRQIPRLDAVAPGHPGAGIEVVDRDYLAPQAERGKGASLIPVDPDDAAFFDRERQPAVFQRQCRFAEHLAAPAVQGGDVGKIVGGNLFEIVDGRNYLARDGMRSDVMRSRTSGVRRSLRHSNCRAAFPFSAGFGDRGRGRAVRRRRFGAPLGAVKPLRQRAQAGEPLQGGRCMGGDIADGIILQHAAARHVAALRLLFAPGGDLHEHASSFGLRTRVFSRSQARSGWKS